MKVRAFKLNLYGIELPVVIASFLLYRPSILSEQQTDTTLVRAPPAQPCAQKLAHSRHSPVQVAVRVGVGGKFHVRALARAHVHSLARALRECSLRE